MPHQKRVLAASALGDSNQIGSLTRRCSVKIYEDFRVGEFVIFLWKNTTEQRIGRILKRTGQTATVQRYLRKDELPIALKELRTEKDEEVTMLETEVLEDGRKEGAISDVAMKSIVAECKVERSKAASKKQKKSCENREVYICRYRLIKHTSYVLMPVEWKAPNVLEQRANDLREGKKTAPFYADNQIDYEPDDPLGDDNFELADDGDETTAKLAAIQLGDKEPTVSPIKIVTESGVVSVKRTASQDSGAFLDAANDVSPSKRAKVRGNGANSPTSPTSRTPVARKNSARKNLNTSFRMEHHYEIIDNDESSLKMKIANTKKSTEMHLGTPSRKQPQIEKLRAAEITPHKRKSIIKQPSSNNMNTPKKNVRIVENAVVGSDAYPSTPGRPKREAAARAMAGIIVSNDSPEEEHPEPRPKRQPSVGRNTDADYATPVKAAQECGPATPKSSRLRTNILKTPSKTGELTPQMTRKLYRSGNLTPSLKTRKSAVHQNLTELQLIRERLHVSAVPQSLPCRETEYENICTFVRDKIVDGCGGCIYIAGVPGTGKTATVTQVVKALQEESRKRLLPKFDYVDINGMRLTEPHQAYVQMQRQLTGTTVPWAQARDLLERRFTKTKTGRASKDVTTILLVDELDILCNRKQDVVYNLFDWTSKKGSKLVAITIANTMDLPERVLKLKVASRLGLTRITFQPYTFKQLQQVVMTRLAGSESFISDAVQLVARKVASVSGDCRRALDICRRATEIAEEVTRDTNAIVRFAHVTQALDEMFASPKVRAIRNCSKMEKLFLRAVATEITRTGIEEVDFLSVYTQVESLAAMADIRLPIVGHAQRICLNLGASRILIVEDSPTDLFQKIILNMSVDDLYFALNEAK